MKKRVDLLDSTDCKYCKYYAVTPQDIEVCFEVFYEPLSLYIKTWGREFTHRFIYFGLTIYKPFFLYGLNTLSYFRTSEGNCKDLGLELLALEVMPDHIHLFVGALPTHTPYKIVKQLKGNTSIQLRRVFPYLKYLGYQKHIKRFPSLWARGYYCGSAGHVSQDSVKRYILEQEGKDVFEYNIYGCPPDKNICIGDFTQSKIDNFGGNNV